MQRKRHHINFEWPVKGLDRFWSNRKQPELTSPDLKNVRAGDPIEERIRGGQRPGTVKAYAELIGPDEGSPSPSPTPDEANATVVRMMGQVTRVKDADTYTGTDEDNFDRPNALSLGEGWSTAAWTSQGLRVQGNTVWDSGMAQYSANVRQVIGLSDLVAYKISTRRRTWGRACALVNVGYRSHTVDALGRLRGRPRASTVWLR